MRQATIERLDTTSDGRVVISLGTTFRDEIPGQRTRLVQYQLFGRPSLLLVFEDESGGELDTIKVSLDGATLDAIDAVAPGECLCVEDSCFHQVFTQHQMNAITVGQMKGVCP